MRTSYFVLLLLFLSSCQSKGLVEVCFTSEQDCEAVMAGKIISSEDVRCAFYDIDSERIIQVLKATEAEVLVFEDNYDEF